MTTSTATCICAGPIFPGGEPVNITVGCRIHHLMADGAPAADHEVRCMCGNFADDRQCAVFLDRDDGAEDLADPVHVCAECQPWADEQPHLHREAS